jgi:multiple sugar transport system ATP-binding protein
MDEPLSNLDAKLRVQTRAELIELQRRLSTTVVYVTHDQVEAMTMGHRIAILNDGVLQQVGPPQQVYERPDNVFVARFIGNPAMNTLDASVVRDGAESILVVGSARVPLPPSVGVGEGPLVVGVRPEHVELTVDGPLPAIVTVVESLGHERHVVCRLEQGDMVIVRQDAAEHAPGEGSAVRLTADLEHLHLFDAETGLRLEPVTTGAAG